MPPTSRDVVALAQACAVKVDLPRKLRSYPSFAEIEDQCEAEYEELLNALHEDDLFAPVDLDRQQQLVDRITQSLPEGQRELVDDLVDNQARHVWLQQEGAYHLGLAMGLRIARSRADRAFTEDLTDDDGDPDEDGLIH